MAPAATSRDSCRVNIDRPTQQIEYHNPSSNLQSKSKQECITSTLSRNLVSIYFKNTIYLHMNQASLTPQGENPSVQALEKLKALLNGYTTISKQNSQQVSHSKNTHKT